MTKIAIIIGSTRPNRKGDTIARWVYDIACQKPEVTFELLDIQDYHLPLLDEPTPPMAERYTQSHTKAWSAKIAAFDGYVFVTPEYNKGTSAALKNAIDYLFTEWNNKACGFVGYGMAGGISAVESLRLVMGELMVADVREQVGISLLTDFSKQGGFNPAANHETALNTLLDQVVAWSSALRMLRIGK